MKRVALRQQFNGEPASCEQDWSLEGDVKDEVVYDVVGGCVTFMAPSDVPDDQLLEHNLSERFIGCNLKLENGAELILWINQEANDGDVRFISPQKVKVVAKEKIEIR